MRDTTGFKSAEDALQKSETRFRDIVDNASVWIWETDRNLRHVYTNLFVTACLGYQPDEFLVADIFSLVHPEDHETMKEVVRRATTERKGWGGVVFRWRHKDGSWRSIESSGRAIFDGDGNLLGLRGLDQDITERKKAQEALRDSEERLNTILDNVGAYIFIKDTHYRYTYANRKVCDLFGRKPQDIVGKGDDAFFSHASVEEIMQSDHRVIERGETITREETELVSSDNMPRTYWTVKIPMRDNNGNISGLCGISTDITERRKIEEALRESEQTLRESRARLDLALRAAHMGVWHWDIIENRRSFDDQVCLLLGLDPATFTGSAEEFFGAVHPDDRESVRAALARTIGQDTLYEPEYRTVWPDGSVHYITARGRLARDDKGRPVRIIGILWDITGRRQAEEALRESEGKFRRLAETINEVFWLGAADWSRIYYINPCYELVWGRQCDELYRDSMLWLESVVEEDRQAIIDTIPRPGFAWHGELRFPDYRILRPDGTIRWISARAYPIRNTENVVTSIAGIAEDITDRKEAEERIRASEKKFSAIFSLIPDPTTITDIETGRIIDLNEAAAHWFGRPREELIGMTTADVQVWTDHSDRDRMLREMKNKSEINDMEFRLRMYNGEVRDVLFSSRIIEISGQRYLLSRVHDITEVKRAEEEKLELERQLTQAQKMEGLGLLAGGIAHDFNNLLQGIFGYISMAKITIDQREKSLVMLEQAERALHQSVSLSSQLLTFSKGGKPVKKRLELKPVVEDAAKFALSGSRVDYAMDIDADLRLVEADEGQIGQVIQNLVINADQAMPMGGRVIITVKNVQAPGERRPAVLPPGNYVRISVQDSGVGMPPQYLERIFDPYFTTKEKGSGLGLAISYSIISNHGGTIDVISEIGRGSTFSVYLPATEEAPAVTPVSPEADRKARKGRILLMDDEPVVRKVASEMIKVLGHEVECTEHGDQTLRMFLQARRQGTPFDVVILDLTIRGGMGGAETIRKLLKIDPRVKAVVSSGYADDSIIADYRSYGFCATLSKPYRIETLRSTLNALLRP